MMQMCKNATVSPKSVVQEVHYTLSYTLNAGAVSPPPLMFST